MNSSSPSLYRWSIGSQIQIFILKGIDRIAFKLSPTWGIPSHETSCCWQNVLFAWFWHGCVILTFFELRTQLDSFSEDSVSLSFLWIRYPFRLCYAMGWGRSTFSASIDSPARDLDSFDIRWAAVLWSFGRHGPTRYTQEWIVMRSVNYFCRQPIKSDHVFFNMSFRHVYVFGLQFWCSCSCPYRGHDSPSPRSTVQNMPAVLSSGVGSDRTRPNRLDLWNLNGSDPIGSDRSFEFRCRTAARPERKGTANLLSCQ